MKVKIIYWLIFVAVFSSCQEINEQKGNKVFINLENTTIYKIKDICDILEIIPLATNENSLIGKIYKIMVYNDFVLVLDRKQKSILMFNKKGDFIRKIHKIGKGPGEYLDIGDFTVDKFSNHIELIDGRNLLTYDFDGNFIRREKIINNEMRAINNVAIVEKNLVAFISIFEENGARIYSREEKKIVKTQNLLPQWTRDKIPFGNSNTLYSNNNINNYFEGFTNIVYKIDKNGFTPDYEWDFGDFNFTYSKPPLLDELKNSSIQETVKKRDYYFKKYVLQFRHNVENEKYIITDFYFKNKPFVLIYYKPNKTYVLLQDEITELVISSKLELTNTDEIYLIIDPLLIGKLDESLISEKDKQLFNKLKISDNPFILKFNLKNQFFVNLMKNE